MAKTAAEKPEKALKIGVTATNRLDAIKKETSAKKATEVRTKAEELARAENARMVKIEHVFQAEGRKATAEEIKEYRREALGGKSGTSSSKGSGRGNAPAAAEKKGTTKPSSGRKRSGGKSSPKSPTSAKKTQTSSPSSKTGKQNGTADTKESASERLRELREKQTQEREQAQSESPAAEESPGTLL